MILNKKLWLLKIRFPFQPAGGWIFLESGSSQARSTVLDGVNICEKEKQMRVGCELPPLRVACGLPAGKLRSWLKTNTGRKTNCFGKKKRVGL